MNDVLTKWADPQLWFVFGLPALLLVGLVVLLSSGVGMVVWALWNFLHPRMAKAFDLHAEFMTASIHNESTRTAAIEKLTGAVAELKPELSAHSAALSHGAKALGKLPVDPAVRADVDHHVRGMQDALHPHVVRCSS